jgi:hypothetical protein
MEDPIKEDIITVLREVVILLKDGEYEEIKELSNHTIHNASIFQDQDSISVAIIIYSISKIMARGTKDGKDLAEKLSSGINDAVSLLEKDRVDDYRSAIKNIFKQISNEDERLSIFIEDVIAQAEIKKGSKMYEHGISMARAAELLGISQWELMSYVGKTTISEITPLDVKKRLDLARSLFEA